MKTSFARLAGLSLAIALACAAAAATAAAQPSYSPYAGRSFPERLLWGDTHLHTNMSADAGSFGNRDVGPEEAYRFARGETVTAHNGMPLRLARPLDLPLREARETFERLYFEHHLQLEDGNITRLAEKTGLERTHLYRKLKQLGIQVGRRSEA